MTRRVSCSTCDAELEIGNEKPSQSIWGRVDHYGIYTGLYCNKCYNSDSYPYRRDAYYDPSYAGERLEEDY